MQDDDKPKLTVVSGGKDNTSKSKRSGKTETGLTVKQEAFAQGLANGLSNADAYRAAYDASGMKANVVHNEACKLAARPSIADRVMAIVEEKRRKNSVFTEKARERHSDRIWARIWGMLDDPMTPPPVKASLLSLGAKAAGMLVDRVETKTETVDSNSIETELLERLQRLTG